MKYELHRNEERGRADAGWLKTRYSFSFANWFEPTRMGFGTLRVLNDDTIAPHSGFPPHSHRDMEIMTLVTAGTITHKDSMGNTQKVREGEVQVMSAGHGVTHAEYNEESEPLSLFQIWIETNNPDSQPRYEQRAVGWHAVSGHTSIVGPMQSDAPLHIQQDAYIDAYGGEEPATIPLLCGGLYAFVVSGTVRIADETLHERDAMAISLTEEVRIQPEGCATLLCIHTPLVY